jgi:ABC-type multidrug transport system ATPase subunit
MTEILKTTNIIKQFGNVKALDDVSFVVPKGSIFGILGPNGSGKTTLLGIITDVLKPDTGSYRWFDEDNSEKQRQKIGTLLETPNFYSYLTAEQNLRISAAIKGSDGKNIYDALQVMGLFEKKDSKFSTFSLGMKQRLSIAATLLGNPMILILDEPTNALDPEGIAQTRELIKKLNSEGKTIIIASHMLDEVEKICTHVAILKKGKLITSGHVEHVFVNEDVVEIGSPNMMQLIEAFKKFEGYTQLTVKDKYINIYFPKGKTPFAELTRYCSEKGILIDHLQIKRNQLEEKYFELTR